VFVILVLACIDTVSFICN